MLYIFEIFFLDKPSKPTIEGDLNITVDSFLELHCSIQSHSAPEYYAKLVSLHFMWFLNNTKLTNEYNNTLRRHVSRVDRNSQYSCIVKNDTVESAQSDPVQINLLCKSQSSEIRCYFFLSLYVCMILLKRISTNAKTKSKQKFKKYNFNIREVYITTRSNFLITKLISSI